MSGNTARPSTLFQPTTFARPGANSEANTVPELPAPAMPSAMPWYCGGYQREVERQRDRERRAGDAQHEAERERAAIAVDLDEPRDAAVPRSR